MSDEKPTCKHGETGRHPLIATEDLIYMSPERVESLPGWCPGPVVVPIPSEKPEATPEMMREIEHRLRLSQVESGKAAITICKEKTK